MPAQPESPAARGHRVRTLAELLAYRAAVQPRDIAYRVLSDRGALDTSVTFREFGERAAAMAARIAQRAAPGERALLLCPNGIGFLVGLFGCVLAGVIAVPLMVPRRQSARDAGAAIVADCSPRLALAPAALIAGERGDLAGRFADAGLEWLAVDDPETGTAAPLDRASCAPEDIAFLQYTSGSTSTPKGVMLSHANLLANLAMIAEAFGNTRASTYVSWVPLYHDMGLIVNALQSLYIGAACVLMAPVAFMQRPFLWLRAIAEYRAEVACAPNFAYDLCVERYRPEQMEGVDLSGWRLALNGAEPVRADTIRRFIEKFGRHGFEPTAVYPAYGLAEATVLVAAGRRGRGASIRNLSREALRRQEVRPPQSGSDTQPLVGCGQPVGDEEIAIVDPETRRRLGAGAIGEVWVRGSNVAAGYWQKPEATEATFGARLAGDETGRCWLRTGDLGFRNEAGELFITGRIKEVLIVRGTNHYPQDIEHTVQGSHPALSRHGGAAFTACDECGIERLIIVQEVERSQRHQLDTRDILSRIREAVVREHEILPAEITLLRPGALPKTTSGKIQRARARDLWLSNALDRL